jgi:hypothetical protein
VARALGRTDIDATVTEVHTRVGARHTITYADLPTKSLEREFFERVPLPMEARPEIQLTDSWNYARLAENVEAWGFRLSQDRGEQLSRRETAYLWLETEYRPVIGMLREAQLIGNQTETETYMRISGERYRLLRTHRWDEDVIQQVIADESGRGRKRR